MGLVIATSFTYNIASATNENRVKDQKTVVSEDEKQPNETKTDEKKEEKAEDKQRGSCSFRGRYLGERV